MKKERNKWLKRSGLLWAEDWRELIRGWRGGSRDLLTLGRGVSYTASEDGPGRKSFHINLTTTVSKVKQITVSGHLEPLKSHFLYLYKVKTIATITECSNKTNVFVYQVRPISKFKLVKVWTTYTGRITGIDAVHASR